MYAPCISHHIVYRSSSSGSEQQASGGIGLHQADPGMAKKPQWRGSILHGEIAHYNQATELRENSIS